MSPLLSHIAMQNVLEATPRVTLRQLLISFSRVIFAAFLGCSLMLVLCQDAFIFPGGWLGSSHSKYSSELKELDPRLEAHRIQTPDGESLELWRLAPSGPIKGGAIIFRGNDGPLDLFEEVQSWAAEQGLVTYLFNYRGYGESSGHPSQQGLLTDADAVFTELLRKEKLKAEQVYLFGISLGNGPASHLAAEKSVAGLFLISGYASIHEAVLSQPIFNYYAPFLRTDFRPIDEVKRLNKTCLVVAHGKLDPLFPFERHPIPVFHSYGGVGYHSLLLDDWASHVDAFHRLKAQLSEELTKCERGPPPPTS